MQVNLKDNFRINSDGGSVWIEQKCVATKGKTAGQEIWRNYDGYHANLSQCLTSFLNRKVNLSDEADIRGLLKEVEQAKKEIKQILNNLPPITEKRRK